MLAVYINKRYHSHNAQELPGFIYDIDASTCQHGAQQAI
jgi:hypothetical protein